MIAFLPPFLGGFVLLTAIASAAPSVHSNEVRASITTRYPPANFRLAFIGHLFPDVANPRHLETPSGEFTNIGMLGGNWTTPSGELLATMLPGVGGEHGHSDSVGVFHADVRYTVQFASDNKYGYVQFFGYQQKDASSTKVIVNLETDSASGVEFTETFLYGAGTFQSDGMLLMYHYIPI